MPREKENRISLATVLRMDPPAKKENHNGLWQTNNWKVQVLGVCTAPKSTRPGRREGWKTKKGAFHSAKFISFQYLWSAADSARGHLALFPDKGEEDCCAEQTLERPVAWGVPFVKKINIDCSCILVVKVCASLKKKKKKWGGFKIQSSCPGQVLNQVIAMGLHRELSLPSSEPSLL